MAKHKKPKPSPGKNSKQRPHPKPPKPRPPPFKTHRPLKTNPSTSTSKPSRPQRTTQTPTLPFNPSDRILLVGEGDFSFARSLIEEHHCHDVTATCLDSQCELYEKYAAQGEDNTTYLVDCGQRILYGIDATKLDTTKALVNESSLPSGSNGHGERLREGFDRIFFNFPHIGGKSTDVNRQVRANQELLVGFFKAAQPLLSPSPSSPFSSSAAAGSGEEDEPTIIVTLFEREPYTLWNIRDLARHTGLVVKRSFRFDAAVYPGYRHARTLGNVVSVSGGAWKGEERDARSFVFARKSEEPRRGGVEHDIGSRKRKRIKDGGGSDDD